MNWLAFNDQLKEEIEKQFKSIEGLDRNEPYVREVATSIRVLQAFYMCVHVGTTTPKPPKPQYRGLHAVGCDCALCR